ncbi:hypothetical protein CFN17_11760 [Arthrobacter sp. PM3]|nr:hypothetical protein CFN17_11760 [Arthrobacter sp. PM3]
MLHQMSQTSLPLPSPGDWCQPDERRSGIRSAHEIQSPEFDLDLWRVYEWLLDRPIGELLRIATDDAVKYVLDGARTWRFDLSDQSVDSDERASVGVKLQYHVIQKLGLSKEPPLDTSILGTAVEIKGTVRNTWMIPREGQCEVTLLIRIDAVNHTFAAWLMRTHRAWLTGKKGNRDLKRSPRAEAVRRYALEVVPWTDLPPEPLRLLNHEQLKVIFHEKNGLRRRLTALFEFLPMVVVPRESISVVGAGLRDPMRRAREVKNDLRSKGLILLVGTWKRERKAAEECGFDLPDEAWVAVPLERFQELSVSVPPLN